MTTSHNFLTWYVQMLFIVIAPKKNMTGKQLVDFSTNVVYNLKIIDESKTTKPVWRGGKGSRR